MASVSRADSARGEQAAEVTRPIKVMLVDDHPVVCVGIRAGWERFTDVTVDCEATDCAKALALVSRREIDVAIIDVRLPDCDGLDLAEQFRRLAPDLRVIMISGDFARSAIERGVQAGVRGFSLKTESPLQLAEFVRRVMRGEYCCSSQLEEQLRPGPQGFGIAQEPGRGLSLLSERERDMLVELANGSSLKQASINMGLSYKSADYLKQNIMKKLEIHDRVELARFAVREGLLR
ncbi:MAG: response regulator transcription factor [Planctomycetaceae bacterium]